METEKSQHWFNADSCSCSHMGYASLLPCLGLGANMQRMVPSPGTPHPLSKLTVGFMKKQYPNLAAEGEGGYKRISRPVMMHGH